MKSGGQPGNTCRARGKMYSEALETALVLSVSSPEFRKRRLEKLPKMREALVRLGLAQIHKGFGSDTQAANHIADRIDGKPAQALDIEQKTESKIVFTPQLVKLLGKGTKSK